MATNPYENFDQELDLYVDTGQGSYTDAWAHSGQAPEHGNEEFTADAIRARSGAVHESADSSDDQSITDDWDPRDGNQKGGFNHAAWASQSPEQKRVTSAAIEAGRRILGHTPKD